MIGAPLGLEKVNGALQVTARRGDVAEDHVRFSEAPSRLGYFYIFRTVVTLEYRERPLKQLERRRLRWRIRRRRSRHAAATATKTAKKAAKCTGWATAAATATAATSDA